MQISRAEATALLLACGWKNAAKWDNDRLVGKFAQMEEIVDSKFVPPDELKVLFDGVMSAVKIKEAIVVVSGPDDPVPAAKPVKGAAKKAAAEKDGQPAGPKAFRLKLTVEPTEANPVTNELVLAKLSEAFPGVTFTVAAVGSGGPRKRGGGEGKPGVVKTIVGLLEQATAATAPTKEDILDVLCERFPDRERDGMKITVGAQIYKLRREGTPVHKTEEGGYYIHAGETAAASA